MKLIAHGQTHKRTHTLDTLIVPFDKLRHVPNGQLTNAIVSVCATLSAGDLRARVAEQAFGKPFAKVTISKCGVYDDATAPPPVEEAVVVVEPQQVGGGVGGGGGGGGGGCGAAAAAAAGRGAIG